MSLVRPHTLRHNSTMMSASSSSSSSSLSLVTRARKRQRLDTLSPFAQSALRSMIFSYLRTWGPRDGYDQRFVVTPPRRHLPWVAANQHCCYIYIYTTRELEQTDGCTHGPSCP